MKRQVLNIQNFFLLLLTLTIQLPLLAQDESSTTTTSTSKTEISVTDSTATEWYTSPWVWIIGAAVFILLLVALLSNRGTDRTTTDRVVIKKEVDHDRDTI